MTKDFTDYNQQAKEKGRVIVNGNNNPAGYCDLCKAYNLVKTADFSITYKNGRYFYKHYHQKDCHQNKQLWKERYAKTNASLC